MEIVVIISAVAEWKALCSLLEENKFGITPYGEYFCQTWVIKRKSRKIVFMHGGWGKIAAAASAQYAIDRWDPKLLVNLGTCGGITGEIDKGAILLVEKTLVYDIYEAMGDAEAHIDHYTTDLDLSWLKEPYPGRTRGGLLISGDRDLLPGEIKQLNHKYGASAGDWESGAIAFVSSRNLTPCLILRGVSDLVSEEGGELYDNPDLFQEEAGKIMDQLLKLLPEYLEAASVLT